MDSLLPFLTCFAFILWPVALILGIISLVQINSLRREVAWLRSRLDAKPSPTPARSPATSPAHAPHHTPAPAPSPIPLSPLHPTQPQPTSPIHPITPSPAAESPRQAARDRLLHADPPITPSPLTPLAHTPMPAPAHPPSQPPTPTPTYPSQPPIPLAPHSTSPPSTPPRPPLIHPSSPPHATPLSTPKTTPTPTPSRGLEYFLGMRLLVVIGAILLALSAIFLFKWLVDNNVFDQRLRVITGIAGGLILLAVGQWRRTKEPFIAQGLSAAGIVALYAATLASTTLYHFITPLQGLPALALITALAIALSLQQGPFIAALGLIGGFFTPILIHAQESSLTGLAGYLLLLHVALIVVTRWRGWTILAALSVLASSTWMLYWLLARDWVPHDGPILGLFLLVSVFSLILASVRDPEKWQGASAAAILTWFAAATGLLCACLLVHRSGYSMEEWGFFALLVAGSFVLARMRLQYEALPWVSCSAVLALLVAWAGPGHRYLNEPAYLQHLIWLVSAFGIATTLAAYGCMWGSAVPARWSLLSTSLAIAFVASAYWIIPAPIRPDEWAFLPLAAGGAMLLLSIPVLLRRSIMRTAEESLAIFAHGILFLWAIAAPMALTEAPLTAAWSILLPVTVLAAWRLKIPSLTLGALGVVMLLAIRCLAFPWILQYAAGDSLFWNPIVWTYGSVLVAMVLAVLMAERLGDVGERWAGIVPNHRDVSALLQTCAVVVGFLLLTFEIRWFFHNGSLGEASTTLIERGTYSLGWMIMAGALAWMGQRLKRLVLIRCGEILGILGILYTFGISVLLLNPLWWGDPVGTMPVFNNLLFIYGVPALLSAGLAYLLCGSYSEGASTSHDIGRFAGIAAIIFLFTLVTLEVRQGFHPLDMRLGIADASFLEWATYPIAWLALAAICIATGHYFNRPLLSSSGLTFALMGIAFALGVVGLAINPVLYHESVGGWIIFNQLLYAYGTPLLLCTAIAFLARGKGATDLALRGLMRVAGVLLLFILVTLEVRQGFRGEFIDTFATDFIERSTYPIAWILLGAGLLAAGRRFVQPVFHHAGITFAALGLAFVLFICSLIMNPLWWHESVGALQIVNWLVYAYGIPAALSAGLALWLWDRDIADDTLARASAVAGILLVFVLVSLEVRQFFQGEFVEWTSGTHPGMQEMVAYSFAWAILGGLFLVGGVLRTSALLRWSSLVLMFLTIFKVFIIDLGHLKELMRVFSFAGLGLSLMALAFVYHHFVFGVSRRSGTAESES